RRSWGRQEENGTESARYVTLTRSSRFTSAGRVTCEAQPSSALPLTPALSPLTGRGFFLKMKGRRELARHGHLRRTGGRRTNPGHGGFSHVSPHSTLLMDQPGRRGVSASFPAASHGTSPLQFRCDLSPEVWANQCCHPFSLFVGSQLPHRSL